MGQVIAMAESAGPSGIEQALAAAQDQVADLQRQLAEVETTRRGLEKQLGRARKQLADEQAERSTLEEHMINRLEELGDDGAQVSRGCACCSCSHCSCVAYAQHALCCMRISGCC